MEKQKKIKDEPNHFGTGDYHLHIDPSNNTLLWFYRREKKKKNNPIIKTYSKIKKNFLTNTQLKRHLEFFYHKRLIKRKRKK